jgi:hypothetical protein
MRRRESDPGFVWLREVKRGGCREGGGKGMQGRRVHGHGARAHVWNGVGIVRLPYLFNHRVSQFWKNVYVIEKQIVKKKSKFA